MKLSALLASLLLAVASSGFAAITVEKTPSGGAIVKVDGQLFAEYVVDQANKPFLAPVFGPTGKQMTRNFPMKIVEGEQHDHPHHRGICFGHQSINGFESWSEEATFAAGNFPALKKQLGREKHRAFKTLEATAGAAVVVSIIEYLDPRDKKYLEEERSMTFRANGDTRSIDLTQIFTATEGPVRFGDKKDAGLSIRVPTEMCVKTEKGEVRSGHIINSEGQTDAGAWGKRAKWCDYYGVVGSERVGVAVLNHPTSFRFPTPWHVRTYGLLTANPFASQSFDKRAPDAAFDLKQGEKLLLRHRYIFHLGDAKDAKIAEAFEAYAREK